MESMSSAEPGCSVSSPAAPSPAVAPVATEDSVPELVRFVHGHFDGVIDEVRVWDRALSLAEIQTGQYDTVTSGTGLVGRWALDQADGDARDSVGNNDGTISGGASFVTPGGLTGAGTPPTATAAAPAEGATVSGGTADLQVDVTDPDGDDTVVTFYLREIPEPAPDFQIAVLPDTQYLTEDPGLLQYFQAQTTWVMNNAVANNIQAVIHNGDLTENYNNVEAEFQRAETVMSTLEATSNEYPDGVPYIIAVGNHDENNGNTSLFNQYFGTSRFMGRSYYGGSYGNDNDNSYITFDVGSLKMMVVTVEWNGHTRQPVMDWARQTIQAHPDHFVIVNVHYLIGQGNPASFSTQGQGVFDEIDDLPNVKLMTCGHIGGEGRRQDTVNGNTIYTMLADYQFRTNSGDSWTRLWNFSPANNELTVRTYNILDDAYETDGNSEFTIPLDLSGDAGPFAVESTLDPHASGSQASAAVALQSGTTYEWYAEVSDCVHTVRTPVRRFTAG